MGALDIREAENRADFDAFVEAGSDPQLQDLLDSYRYASDKLTFHMVDPDKERDLAERYHVTELPTVHIQYGEQTATVAPRLCLDWLGATRARVSR